MLAARKLPLAIRATASAAWSYTAPVDYFFLTNLDEIPALLRWVESCAHSGYMSENAAADWRGRIEEWREWLERTSRVR